MDGSAFFSDVVGGDSGVDTSFEEVFTDATPILAVRWWGSAVNGSFAPCTNTPQSFTVTFYSDADGFPGGIISNQDVIATATTTDTLIGGDLPLFQYDASLVAPVTVAHGWLSVRARVPTTAEPCGIRRMIRVIVISHPRRGRVHIGDWRS